MLVVFRNCQQNFKTQNKIFGKKLLIVYITCRIEIKFYLLINISYSHTELIEQHKFVL